MEEELGLELDNILTEDEISTLFEAPPKETKEGETTEQTEDTTEIDEEHLFDDEHNQSESVGSEDRNNKEKEDTDDKGLSSPPNNKNFYSSIADALVEDGVFPDLDKETITKVQTPEDFQKLIEDQINARLDEKQKRINEALNNGVQPSEIQQYERTINYLDSLTDEVISEEGDKGEQLRKQLIYQDYINRGFSQNRAIKMVEDSINNGTDIDDAKDALQGNKDFFSNKYEKMLADAKAEEEKIIETRKKQSEELKNSIMTDKKLYGDVDIDKATRQKIFDTLSKPIHRDKNGNYMTELQKYQAENTVEAMKNFAICYTLTNGFKDWSKLGSRQAKKEVKKGLANLERVINSTSRTTNGSLNYMGGIDDSSYLGQGMTLDI